MQRPNSCVGCPLQDSGKAISFMQPEGSGSNGVLFVAEALGAKEALDGLPLRPNAPAGSILAGIIRRLAGHERNHFLFSNTIWCQPGPSNWLDGAPYEYAAIEHCQQYNKELISKRRPRAIVALGAIPTRTITGMHGYNQGIKLVRGYQLFSNRPEYFVDEAPIPVVPTYHPSFLLRASKTRSKEKDVAAKVEKAEGGMSLSGVMMRDIELALSIAKHGPLIRPEIETVKGNRDTMDILIKEFELHPEWPLYWDIETPRSLDKADDESEIDSLQAQVKQIQFGYNKERGFVFPGFEAEYVKEGTRKLLGQRNRRMFTWNGWGFDDKVVMGHHQVPILGINIDLMSAWSWLQPDLPKGLQFVASFFAPEIGPWKHLAFDAEDIYGTYDVVSLAYNHEGIFSALEKRGLMNSYERHVLMLRPEMVMASNRGFPVDKERHDEFGKEVKTEIDKITNKINTLIPEELLNLEPKRKKKENSVPEYGYVNTPKQILEHLDSAGIPKNGSDRITLTETISFDGENGTGGETEEMETRTVHYVRRNVSVFNKQTLELDKVLRWCRLVPFSAGSSQQKIRYIEYRRAEEVEGRIKGYTLNWNEDGSRSKHSIKPQDRATAERLAKYKVPKVRNKMKEMKDNTGAKELEKLYKDTGDPVFHLLVDIGKLNKLYGTYYKGWKIVDGAVHTTFGLANTGTGQLVSTEPNIQNCPRHSDLAQAFRKCIKALPNKILIEIDKKSFHAQTLALAARDKAYARLSAIDVHSFMTAHRLNLPEAKNLLSWSDKDMSDWFSLMKKSKTVYKAESVPNYPDGLTFKQIRDYKSKRVILGIGFCQGAQSIFEQNPEGYKDKKEVQSFLDLVKELFGGIFKFHVEITQLAHKQTHLISKWGYIRRFYDVFKWNPQKWNQRTGSMGDWEHGDDYEAAVAFFPANHAFGMIKEEMLRLAGYRLDLNQPFLATHVSEQGLDGYFKERPKTTEEWEETLAQYAKDLLVYNKENEDLLKKYGFVNQIHDSIIYHCNKNLSDRCLEDSLRIMRDKCLVLKDEVMCPDGFFVDAEASIGPDWASMEPVS